MAAVPQISALLSELEGGLKKIYPRIVFGLGEKDLAARTGTPRVVWILTTTKHGPPRKDITNPRRLLTREHTFVAHCWAADERSRDPMRQLDACEALVHNLLVLVRKAAWGSVEFGGEQWMQPDHVDFGHAALVTFVAHVPVHDVTYRTVQIINLEADVSNALAGDNQTEWGEP